MVFRLIQTLLLLMFSCTGNEEGNLQEGNEDEIQPYVVEVLIYPVNTIEDISYSFYLNDYTLKMVDYLDSYYQQTIKSIGIDSSQIEELKCLTNQINYQKPTSNGVVDTWELKVIVNEELVYHVKDYYRGQLGGENVDALIDKMLNLLEYKLRLYGF
jgi:hypothetical protein